LTGGFIGSIVFGKTYIDSIVTGTLISRAPVNWAKRIFAFAVDARPSICNCDNDGLIALPATLLIVARKNVSDHCVLLN
jgi:hypothetical protein